jgi:hypothetical protein
MSPPPGPPIDDNVHGGIESSRIRRSWQSVRDDPFYYITTALPIIGSVVLVSSIFDVIQISEPAFWAIFGFLVGDVMTGWYWTRKIRNELLPSNRELIYTSTVGFELWNGAMQELNTVGEKELNSGLQRGQQNAKEAVRDMGLADGTHAEIEFESVEDVDIDDWEDVEEIGMGHSNSR